MKHLFLTLGLALLIACQNSKTTIVDQTQNEVLTKDNTIELISAEEFNIAIMDGKAKQLLDVRTSKEYESGHLPQATLHHIYDADFESSVSKYDKSKPIYVYCKAGGRSAEAAAKLKEMGFQKIYDLDGGISSWNEKGFPIKK